MRTLSCRAVRWLCGALVAVAGVSPAGATTLVRAGLEDLAAANATILVGEVLEVSSYWNPEGTFILSDVRIAPLEVLKGRAPGRQQGGELEVTVMGGTVGDLTTLIVGGAELVPGRSYVLFLDREDLPGAPNAFTVRDHVQGVFELVATGGEVRAVSQAVGHPLVPDVFGRSEPPGGARGIPLTTLVRSLREMAVAGGRVPR